MTLPDETVEHLSNGIVFHRFSGGDQPICKLSLHFSGGMAEMGEATAKVLLSQLSEGTRIRPAKEIAEEIDFNGVRFATQMQTHHCAVSAMSLTSRLPYILPVLADMIVDSVFPQERLDVAKAKFITALRTAREDPSAVADLKLQPLIWGEGNPLAHEMTENDIEAVSTESLTAHHRQLISPSKTHAFLSGLLDEASIAAVREFLERIPALGKGYPIELHPATPSPAGTCVVTQMPGTMQAAISCAIPAPGRQHPDYVPLRFAVMALGGYFGSRLMSNIREDKGLTYGINASLMGGQDGANIYIGTLTDRNAADIVVDEIRHEMAGMSLNPPSGEELERFRTYAMSGLAELLDNPLSVMQNYASQNLVGIPAGYFERQQSVLQNLSSDDIARISAQYLNPDELRISIVR